LLHLSLLLIRKEIKDIPARAGVGAVQFGITALRTSYCNEFFVLNVKKFGYITACGLKLVALVMDIAAFWTFIRLLLH
jgi:hypothetical protein